MKRTKQEKELIRKAMQLLRATNSPAQQAQSRKAADLAWRARWKNHVKKPKLPKKRPKILAKTPAEK